jgi:type I restriction enzyme S subunit
MTAMRSLPLSSVAKIDRVSLAPEKIQSGTAYLGLEHIESGGKILGAQSVDSGELKSSKFRFTSQHILYGKLRPYLAKIALPDFDGICSTDIIPILPGPDIERKYLLYFLRQGSMVDYANSRSSGANLPRLSPKELANFQVPLPPLEEQKRIAKILDAADALLAKRRESLAQLDALMQSTFLGLFGDPVKNEKGWDKVDIGNIARAKPNNGVFRKNDEYTERDGFGVPVVWLEELFKGSKIDVTNARRLPLESKEVAKYGLNYGDILFCRSSLKLDGIAYNNVYLGEDKAAAFECHLIRVSPDLNECDPIFLSAQLRTPPLRACLKSVSKTSTMTTIDQKAISGISVIVPPMEIQSKFARFSASVDLQKEKIRIAIGELDSLFLSLQQKAFSGGI